VEERFPYIPTLLILIWSDRGAYDLCVIGIKYGFIKVIFLLANVVRVEAQQNSAPFTNSDPGSCERRGSVGPLRGARLKVRWRTQQRETPARTQENVLQSGATSPGPARETRAHHAHRGASCAPGGGTATRFQALKASEEIQSCRKSEVAGVRSLKFRIFKRPRYLKLRSRWVEVLKFRIFKRPRYLKLRHHSHRTER